MKPLPYTKHFPEWSHLIPTTALRAEYSYHAHFADEETEAQQWKRRGSLEQSIPHVANTPLRMVAHQPTASTEMKSKCIETSCAISHYRHIQTRDQQARPLAQAID